MALTLLVGPSGVGKTVIWQRVLKMPHVLPFKTNTSRNIREEEMVEGFVPQYRFHTLEGFQAKIAEGAFFEHELYVDNYYGTLLEDIEKAIQDQDHLWVGIVDIRGAKNIMKTYPEVFGIFLIPPSDEELLNRLKKRKTETDEKANKRLEAAKVELLQQNDLSTKVVNDKLDAAVTEVYQLISNNFNFVL